MHLACFVLRASSTTPPAVVTCGDPGTPSNGQRQLSGQNFGTEVTYTCDEGYELEGSQRRTCEARGEWSGELPQCKSKLDRAHLASYKLTVAFVTR